jgi:tRNA modification GTPase
LWNTTPDGEPNIGYALLLAKTSDTWVMLGDTIAAIATPLGEGGLAVIRVSGPKALPIADRCFRPASRGSPQPSQALSHTLHYGFILEGAREIDEVMLAVLRAPRTFTREDTIEISCHGGILSAKSVLDVILAQGARLALPGEFTQRAFVHGRIDLTQAEAVLDLIHARTELALAAAAEQLAGKLSQRIDRLRDDLMQALVHIEAQIDFPEEDIAPDSRTGLLDRFQRAIEFMDDLLRTALEGQILRQGIRAAIVGRPNTGKSSLLNQLLGHDRAIVSPIAGTTRDTIEETANVRGIPVVFIDTAGLREARDPLELEGIRRSRRSLDRAELVLEVLDSSQPLTDEDRSYLADYGDKKRIVVCNKIDLPSAMTLPPGLDTPVVRVCCLTGQGIEELKDAIRDLVWSAQVSAEMSHVMINARHQDALNRAREGMQRAQGALQENRPLELVALDLRLAVNAVGEIVGKTTTEDLLDSIFSQFCVGK